MNVWFGVSDLILNKLVSAMSSSAKMYDSTGENSAHIGLASPECSRAKTRAWKMSAVWPYRSLSLAPVQTKNTFINIHLPCPACTITPFILANPYVRCTRWGSNGELKGLYGRWKGKTTGGWVALYAAFFRRPRPSHRAPPLGWTGRIGVWKVRNTLIWCHMLFQRAPSVYIQVNESGQLLRKHCDRRRCEKVDEALFLLSCP